MVKFKIMKHLVTGYILFCGLILWQCAYGSRPSDPNMAPVEPNIMSFLLFEPDPNTASSMPMPQSIPGTLAANWLFQGKKPPQPLVGQEDVTFRTEIYPWPYIGYHRDNFENWPWFYHPWYRYGYWRYYSNDYRRYYRHGYGWWNWDAYTYPLNYVEVQKKINDDISIHIGASFFSDPVPWP